MRSIDSLIYSIKAGLFRDEFLRLYGVFSQFQPERYITGLHEFAHSFPECDSAAIFSIPARIELIGNHTDHQGGCVIAGSVNLDAVIYAAPINKPVTIVKSRGFQTSMVNLDNLSRRRSEALSLRSILRGTLARFVDLGYEVNGFAAYIDSDIPSGGGLGSSAAMEIGIGMILNHLFNENSIPMDELAQIARYVENNYFMKPCGLIDQLTISTGGLIHINFSNQEKPIVTKLRSTLNELEFIVLNPGISHADLTADYASIVDDMQSVARAFGKNYLSELEPSAFYSYLPQYRKQLTDRAITRAMHFFGENERVASAKAAVLANDAGSLIKLIKASGYSSFTQLQNAYPQNAVFDRPLPLALALTRQMLQTKGGWRIHGGGFAGSILAAMPGEYVDKYISYMNLVFGDYSCMPVQFREGAFCFDN